VITPGTGLVCDPGRPKEYAQAIERLVRDEPFRKSISALAPSRAAVFGIEQNVGGTLAAYREVLAARDGPSLYAV